MTMKNYLKGWREAVAMSSPGIAIFLFVVLTRDSQTSLGDTLVTAAVLGLFAPVVGLLAYSFLYAGLSFLLGEPNPTDKPWESRQSMTAGVLLAAVVWMWWQHDQQKKLELVAACVADAQWYNPDINMADQPASYLVEWCFEGAAKPVEDW